MSLASSASNAAHGGAPDGRVFNFEAASVAIIDSNSLCMELLTNILRGFGFRANYRCHDLVAGADVVKTHPVDLILIDPFPYGQAAYDFIGWMRNERSRSASSSVLIVTAGTSVRVISSARKCGADYVIAKPFSVATLLDRILWVANSEGRRGDLMNTTDVVSNSGSGMELW